MQLSEVAQKLNIPRHYLKYWREIGLLGQSGRLDFQDLVRARFILQCREAGLSLQQIRRQIGRVASSQEIWHTRLVLEAGGRLLEREPGSQELWDQDSGQLHFNYADPDLRTPVQRLDPDRLDEISARDAQLEQLERRYAQALHLGKPRAIQSALEDILKEDPDHLAAIIELGNIHYEQEKLDAARRYYETASEMQPDCVEALYNLANIHFKQERFAAAIRFFQRCIDLDPEFPEAYYNLGLLYSKLGYVEPAIFCMDQYLMLDADSSWSLQAAQLREDLQQAKALTENSSTGNLFPVDS